MTLFTATVSENHVDLNLVVRSEMLAIWLPDLGNHMQQFTVEGFGGSIMIRRIVIFLSHFPELGALQPRTTLMIMGEPHNVTHGTT